MAKAFVVAAPSSGSGKTLITLGMLRAFRNAGYKVRGAKTGPDYIDPGFHEAATGAPCFNLDLWAMGKQTCQGQLAHLAQGSDIILIEGVMGLFDGPQGADGSTADLAAALDLPVVLVVDCGHQAQSVAALVHGFSSFRNDIGIAGLILNKVRSDRHEAILREALKGHAPVLAVVRQSDSIHIPSRHLGLVQAGENQRLNEIIESAASAVARETVLDRFLQIAGNVTNQVSFAPGLPPPAQTIAWAKDDAFNFSYAHLKQHWREQGAKFSHFSPLANEAPDLNADFVFLPGGYPELHAGKLAANTAFLDSLRRFKSAVYGECGGYMVLGESITDAQGKTHRMAGLLPVTTSFATRKLHLGYRALKSLGGPFANSLRGHEFHYSTATITGEASPLYEASDAAGNDLGTMGQRQGQVMGSYAHVIWSAP